MSRLGLAAGLEARRRLAVQRVAEGWKQQDVAAFLGVTERAVNGSVAAHRKAGDQVPRAKAHRGANPKPSK